MPDVYAAITRLLVKEIVDLRETLSFYERELFAGDAVADDAGAPTAGTATLQTTAAG